jgi:hypothetical protein
MGAHDATVIGFEPSDSIDLAGELSRRLVSAFECEGAREARLVSRRQYRWSEHLLYGIHRDRRPPLPVIVKRVKAHDRRGRPQGAAVHPRVRSLAEHGALDTIHRIVSAARVPGLTSIRPYACFSDLDAFAMEYRPGVTVRSLITREASCLSRAGAQGAATASHRAGEWLALVHDALARQGLAVDVEGLAYVVHVGEELRSLAGDSLALDDPLSHAAWSFVEDRIAATGTVRTLPLHGDFYPDNLVRARDGDLYAVDTMLFARGPVEDDLARFLVGVDTLRTRILFGDTLVPVGRLEAVRRAFIDGYRAMRAIDPRLLAASLARALLVRWAELRAAAALDGPAPIVALSRRRIDGFMRARLVRLLGAERNRT